MSSRPVSTLTALECEVIEASRALEPNEASGNAIHLHLLGGRRRWLVRTDLGQLTATVDDPALVPGVDLHLPLSDRVMWFVERVNDGEPTLSPGDGSTAVIDTETARATLDLVPWTGPAPVPSVVRLTASVRLPLWRFARVLSAARVMPTGTQDRSYPTPPLWMQIHSAGLDLCVDWRDFLPSRATYTVACTDVRGQGGIGLPHRRLDDFLRGLGFAHADEDDDAELEVGVGEMYCGDRWKAVVVLTYRFWQLALIAVDVLVDRWGAGVDEQLQPFEVIERTGPEWVVDTGRHPVRVRLRRGHPDCAQVITEVGTGFTETLELLRELSTLNAASNGVRFWFDSDAVWAACDLPCTRLDEIGDAVRAVSDAAATYGPLLAAWC